MTAEARDGYDFDVALSYAGEDRDYVQDVNDALKAAGVRTFLDADHLADTWGEDLVEFFDAIYRRRSRFAILFISRHYAEKTWPRHERRSALARALKERGAYVLPVRLDDTEVDGLRPTVGYLDTRRTGIDALVRAFLAKLAGKSGWPDGWPGDRVPRTQRELDEVRAERPPGWEYLFFAGLLHIRKEALESDYLDHELGYARLTGERVEDTEAAAFAQRMLDEAKKLIGSLTAMMEPAVQERAFGPPGISGDPDRIALLAERWTSIYAGLFQWSARLRGLSHTERWTPVLDLIARMVDGPIEQYRSFVDDFVKHADRIPSAIATKEPIAIQLRLDIEVTPEDLPDRIGAELDRIVQEWDGE